MLGSNPAPSKRVSNLSPDWPHDRQQSAPSLLNRGMAQVKGGEDIKKFLQFVSPEFQFVNGLKALIRLVSRASQNDIWQARCRDY